VCSCSELGGTEPLEDARTETPPSGLTRRELVARGAIGTGGLAFGALAIPWSGSAAPSPLPRDFDLAFGTVVEFTDDVVYLPTDTIRTNASTKVFLDEVALASTDRGIVQRRDGIRFGDLALAAGSRDTDGTLTATSLWSGVLLFRAIVLAASDSAVTLSLFTGSQLRSVASPDTSIRRKWSEPTRGLSGLSSDEAVVAYGIPRRGFEVFDLAAVMIR
jgi:hypothetical protein